MATIQQSIQDISAVLPTLQATKYLAACGLVCALWDHLLTFQDEVMFIWMRGHWDLIRFLFFWNRYVPEAALIYVAYVFAGFHKILDADAFMTTNATLAVISVGTANVFMTLRHYALWDRRKFALIALWSAFAVSYTALCVLFVFTVRGCHEYAQYSPQFETCTLSRKPWSLIGIWTCMLSFDVFTLLLAITNALERPYRHKIDVIVNFKRDGALFFLLLVALRVMNLVVSVLLGAENVFMVAFFVWAMISITMSRLILRVENIKARTPARSSSGIQVYEMDQWRPSYT